MYEAEGPLRNVVVVGVAGNAGVGKGTFAARLRRQLVFRSRLSQDQVQILPMALPIKLAVAAMEPWRLISTLNSLRLDKCEITSSPNVDSFLRLSSLAQELQPLKNAPLIGDVTYRSALQTLGTDWGRNTVDEHIWCRAWRMMARELMDGGVGVIIVDDIRFQNEIDYIREHVDWSISVLLLREVPVEKRLDYSHESERIEVTPDLVVEWQNEGETGSLDQPIEWLESAEVKNDNIVNAIARAVYHQLGTQLSEDFVS